MDIDVLVVKRGGTEEFVKMDVPDNYFDPKPEEPSLDERVTDLETNKADKSEIDNIWTELAAAYTEGVNSI